MYWSSHPIPSLFLSNQDHVHIGEASPLLVHTQCVVGLLFFFLFFPTRPVSLTQNTSAPGHVSQCCHTGPLWLISLSLWPFPLSVSVECIPTVAVEVSEAGLCVCGVCCAVEASSREKRDSKGSFTLAGARKREREERRKVRAQAKEGATE